MLKNILKILHEHLPNTLLNYKMHESLRIHLGRKYKGIHLGTKIHALIHSTNIYETPTMYQTLFKVPGKEVTET